MNTSQRRAPGEQRHGSETHHEHEGATDSDENFVASILRVKHNVGRRKDGHVGGELDRVVVDGGRRLWFGSWYGFDTPWGV